MRGHDWSPAEKKIARAAFDAALETTLAGIMAEFKAKAAAVTEPSEMWELEDYLRERSREVDETFDYRYSQLIDVFARLILDGRLEEKRLDGLGEEKRADIRRIVQFVRSHSS
jgi:hypothetical protein